jgi:hypothetical protein
VSDGETVCRWSCGSGRVNLKGSLGASKFCKPQPGTYRGLFARALDELIASGKLAETEVQRRPGRAWLPSSPPKLARSPRKSSGSITPPIQIEEMRDAFFAGAQHYYGPSWRATWILSSATFPMSLLDLWDASCLRRWPL